MFNDLCDILYYVTYYLRFLFQFENGFSGFDWLCFYIYYKDFTIWVDNYNHNNKIFKKNVEKRFRYEICAKKYVMSLFARRGARSKVAIKNVINNFTFAGSGIWTEVARVRINLKSVLCLGSLTAYVYIALDDLKWLLNIFHLQQSISQTCSWGVFDYLLSRKGLCNWVWMIIVYFFVIPLQSCSRQFFFFIN